MNSLRRSIRENLTALEIPHIEDWKSLQEKKKTVVRLQQELEVSLQHAEVSHKDKEKHLSSIAYYENRIQELESGIPLKRKQIEEHYQLKIQALENERDMKIRKLESTEIPHLKQQLQITQDRLKVGPVLTSRKDIERKMKFEEVKTAYDAEEERHKKKSTLFQLCQNYEAALGEKQSSIEQSKTKYEQVLSKFGGDKTNPNFTKEMENYAKSVHQSVLDLDETIRSLKKDILPLQDSLQVFVLY